MTALLVENLKLIILFLLIGSVIGLSQLGDETAKPARRKRLRHSRAGNGSSLEEANMPVLAHGKNAAGAFRLSATVSFLRNAIGGGTKLLKRVAEVIGEARMQKALIEAELYRNRYKHSSKNDDDLPIAR